MGKVKPIETRYKGYRFRSRLEARWAVFFDSLGIDWQYEPEGYELGDAGRYLPDFFLPSVRSGLWVEVKAKTPTEPEVNKLETLVIHTGHMGTFRVGDPSENLRIAEWNGDSDNAWMWDMADVGGGVPELVGDGPFIFCICPWCGRVGFEFDGRGARVCSHHPDGSKCYSPCEDKCYTGDHPRIKDAVAAARSARFEYGESGVGLKRRRGK